MRHTTLILSALLGLATAATAQPRSEHEMQAIAYNHFHGTTAPAARRAASAKPQQIFTTDMVAAYGDQWSGCVFVSRDAIFAPVLGWTDQPITVFGELPPGLQWWLNTVSENMRLKRDANAMNTIQQTMPATDVAPLVSTRWAQDSPYNDKCPVADNWSKARAQTGCVATAMAQIMKFHQHPAKGQGTGYYTLNGSSSKQRKRIESTYDWANMKDTYAQTSTKDATTDAVATLMYDCGLAVGMAYAVQASGATSVNAARGMATNFDYDSLALHCTFRTFTNDDRWLQTIYDELQQQRPVAYMSTDATYGAHAFVIDGCRAQDGYLHVNWGWSGDANGYFDFFNLNPRTTYQQAYGMQGYNFSEDTQSQSMLTGILPADGVEREHDSYWCMNDEERIEVEGDSLVVHLPTLINYSYRDFRGLVGLCIQDVATGHSPIQPFYYTAWGEQPVPSLNGWNPMDIPYYKSVTDGLADGDYDLFLMSWDEKAINKSMPQYIRFPARNDGNENYNVWRMTKKDGHLSIAKTAVPVVENGISTAERLAPAGDERTFDLQGRRRGSSAAKGIIIKNGKKYVN